MAVFLVHILLKMRAHSLAHCQIILLHAQSKRGKGNSAMQRTHDVRQIFVTFFKQFPTNFVTASLFCDSQSYSASAKCSSRLVRDPRNPLADVLFSC
ncbi:MAG: hypothetical protein ACK4GM_05665 [Tabrizicola sp.]